MRPEELLTTLAQLGVAVAGFSGIVVALAQPAAVESRVRRTMLDVLLLASFGVVLWSLIPLVMLSTAMPERTLWRVASAGWGIQQILALLGRVIQGRRSPESTPVRLLTIPLAVGGLSALLLQIANVAWLGAAWPHLVALVWWLVLSFVIFLLLMGS